MRRRIIPSVHGQNKHLVLADPHCVIFKLWADDSKLKAGKIDIPGITLENKWTSSMAVVWTTVIMGKSVK